MLNQLIKLGRLQLWSKAKSNLIQEHKLNYLFWEATLNCNFYCRHCGSSAGKKHYSHELDTKTIKKVFQDIASQFKPQDIMLAVTGGEPLLRPDLFEVMAYAHQLGFPWGIVTNGFLVTPKVVDQMKHSGMSTAVVSIDGIGKTHDDFRQCPGAYRRAINAVKLISAAKFVQNLQITTCLHQQNFHQLNDMFTTFSKLPINSWRVMNIDPIGRAANNPDLLLTPNQLKQLLQFIKQKRLSPSKLEVCYDCTGFLGPDFEGEVRDWLFFCTTGISTASILHNGDIFVCPNVPRLPHLIQGNVKKNTFVDVWNHKFQIFRDPNRCQSDQCSHCLWWQNCRGSSFHLWDFQKKQPKFCHYQYLNS